MMGEQKVKDNLNEDINSNNDDDFYYVEKILKKQTQPSVKYLVKWEGYDESQATWEPLENLENVNDLIDEFEKNSNNEVNNLNNEDSDYSPDDIDDKNVIDEDYEDSQSFKNTENKMKKQKPNLSSHNQIRLPQLLKTKKEEKIISELTSDQRIENIYTIKIINEDIHCQVKLRNNLGEVWVPSSEISKKQPFTLIDFYESKVKFNK